MGGTTTYNQHPGCERVPRVRVKGAPQRDTKLKYRSEDGDRVHNKIKIIKQIIQWNLFPTHIQAARPSATIIIVKICWTGLLSLLFFGGQKAKSSKVEFRCFVFLAKKRKKKLYRFCMKHLIFLKNSDIMLLRLKTLNTVQNQNVSACLPGMSWEETPEKTPNMLEGLYALRSGTTLESRRSYSVSVTRDVWVCLLDQFSGETERWMNLFDSLRGKLFEGQVYKTGFIWSWIGFI